MKMGGDWRLAAVALFLAHPACLAALSADVPHVGLTQYFVLSSSSSCGDAPGAIEFPQNSGLFQNCSAGQHTIALATDEDPNTWWQSAAGETPVDVTIALQQPAASLRLEAVRVRTLTVAPRYLYLGERRANEDVFTSRLVYVENETRDCDVVELPCRQYTVETVSSDGSSVLLCPLNLSEPVLEVQMRFDGFSDLINETSKYFTIVELELLGWVADGFFARSLTSLLVEAETGVLMDGLLMNQEPVTTSTDESLMTGFSSRGFALISVDDTSQINAQWTFHPFPDTTSYQIWIRYSNPGRTLARTAKVLQESSAVVYDSRVAFQSCPPPAVCYTFLSLPDNVQEEEEFFLHSGSDVSVMISFSSLELYLDVLYAVPVAYYNATVLQDRDGFLANCNFIDGSLGQGTLEEQFCLQAAVELSLDSYQSTYACACSPIGSTGGSCSAYGGHCPCVSETTGLARVTGRQCHSCPFTTYLTPDGCVVCGCPDPSESCSVSTGQCSCLPLVTGRSCDMCVTNSFGDPATGCSPCTCNRTGTEQCHVTTGECICKVGVAGVNCDTCEDGFFNLTLGGCDECGCDSVGSEDSLCNDEGQCNCKSGVGGLKCSSCLPMFFHSPSGCTSCDCSGRTTNCAQNPNVTSEPSEVCVCPSPYAGASCEGCEVGWFVSGASGDCEECVCNGQADTCLDGNGTCVGCRGNSTGARCDVCADGFHDADPGPTLLCLACPCTTTTADSILCSPDSSGSPVCACRPGHEGQTCSFCSEGYFGQPPLHRCTQCDCNGNIDPSIPGSCDFTTGQCLICINNSTGDECESCDTGYYGDATQQDCQPCNCSSVGSEGSVCDPVTGQCACLPGVNGQSCKQCLPTYWNFTSSVGCQSCDCTGSTASESCDPVTGQCDCNPGVGGVSCTDCLDGYFNFSSDACTPCLCGDGASNGSCDSLGNCYCQPGVGGAKCDLCEPFTFNLTSAGCESCGECEQNIRGDLEREVGRVVRVNESAKFLRQLNEADTKGLGEVERVRDEVGEGVMVTSRYVTWREGQVAGINATYVALREELVETKQRVSQSFSLTLSLQDMAEDAANHIQQIYNQMTVRPDDIARSINFAMATQMAVAGREVLACEIQENLTSIASLHEGRNSSDRVRETEMAVMEARGTRDRLYHLLTLAQAQWGQVAELSTSLGDIEASIGSINTSVSETGVALEMVEGALEAASALSQAISRDVAAVEGSLLLARAQLVHSTEVLETEEDRIDHICGEIDRLGERVGSTTPASGSGSASDLLVPASGMGTLQVGEETVSEGVVRLCREVEDVRGEVRRCDEEVVRVEDHAEYLQLRAETIERIIQMSVSAGGEAIEAVYNFTHALRTIDNAINISMTANQTLSNLLDQVRQLDLRALELEAERLRERSLELLDEVKEERNRVDALLEDIATVEVGVRDAARQVAGTAQRVQNVTKSVERFGTGTATTVSIVSHHLNTTSSALISTSSTHSSLSSLLPQVLNTTTAAHQTLTTIHANFEAANVSLSLANNSVAAAEEALNERLPLLGDADRVRSDNEGELTDLTTSVGGLLLELERAKAAAALIDVALRFYGNASLGYTAPLTPFEPATRISMVFNPSETTGLMLHSSPSSADQQTLSLQLSNGSVLFAADVGGDEGVELLSTPPGVVSEDAWYQLYATREGSQSQLSVSPLQGGTTYTSTLTTPTSHTLTLPPTGTVYLGGLPPSERTSSSVDFVGYSGCLDRVLLNNAPLPLLLPNTPHLPLSTCGPRPPAEPMRSLENGAWLQGAGSFIHVNGAPLITGSSPLVISIDFRTLASHGLLLHLLSQDTMQTLSLSLVGGILQLELSLGALDETILQATAPTNEGYNEGVWHYVEVELDGRNISLSVDSEVKVQGVALTASSSPFVPDPQRMFVGGLPEDVMTTTGISPLSLAGCVRNLYISDRPIPLNHTHTISSFRISFDGCPDNVEAGVRFSGEGRVLFPPLSSELSLVSFSFRTTQLASLLLVVGTESSSLVISLYHTRVRVERRSSVLESSVGALNDNIWHSVSVAMGTDTTNLTVDGETVTTPTSVPRPQAGSDVMVGGATTPSNLPVTESFRGCMDNIMFNDMSVDFSSAHSLSGVSLYGCRPEAIPQITTPFPPPPPPLPPPPSLNPNISVGLDGQEGSFLAMPLPREDLASSYTIVLELQTSSPNAMLLYSQGAYDFTALELIRGTLHHTYNLGSGRIIIATNRTYNDGRPHVVELRRSGREGSLLVDGGRGEEGEEEGGMSPGGFTVLNVETDMLFVGGTPVSMAPSNLILFRTTGEEIPPSTLGCFLSLSVNGVYMNLSSPQASSGTEGCRQFYNNQATFHGQGYLQFLDEFNGGTTFSLTLELRTAQCSGLLAYVESSTNPDHTVVEIVDGTIRFVFDNGAGPTFLEYQPQATICNNEWHSLTIIKQEITGTLSLDAEPSVSSNSRAISFVSMDTDSPLFIGGVPDNRPLRSGVANAHFTGCIRNVYVSTSRTGPLERNLAQASRSRDTTFHTCTP